MDQNFEARIAAALAKSKTFIEELTVHSSVNRPGPVVTGDNMFFSWDNEHRSKKNGAPYLYSWSYYNGVIFEGLKDIYEKTGDPDYMPYIKEFMDALITDGMLNEHAGYVPYHGLDCYKTASLLMEFCEFNEDGTPIPSEYTSTAKQLYHDLIVENACHTEEALGGNYWHSWRNNTPPKYKVWLDGIYMAQPFAAKYAYASHDEAQLETIYKRFRWVADTLLAPNGLYYHAGNSKDDFCNFFWLRAIGWYAMAQVDVMPYMSGANLEAMKKDLKNFIDGMLKFQDEGGMWCNLVDQPRTETNLPETSGTAMIIYCILKAIRMGWLEDPTGAYKHAAQKAFCYMAEEKLNNNALKDIYLMASASGVNNYEKLDWYKVDEGKGTGPYIMAYAEMIKA